jgi:hypothetical protein
VNTPADEPIKKLYTLEQATPLVLAEFCRERGYHTFTVTHLDQDKLEPTAIVCNTCGSTWKVVPG